MKKNINDPALKDRAWQCLLSIKQKRPGVTQTEIATKMMQAGWYKGEGLRPLTQETISYFMKENGMQLQIKTPRKKVQPPVITPLHADILNILSVTSHMEEERRIRILLATLETYSEKKVG